MHDPKRQTGRTTRMLEAAIASARTGRAVYVVVAMAEHRKIYHDNLRRMTGDDVGIHPLGIQVETEHTLGLGRLDWRTMTLRGAHPNVVVFADHYAIECHLGGTALEMMTRFDEPGALIAASALREVRSHLQYTVDTASELNTPGTVALGAARALKALKGAR